MPKRTAIIKKETSRTKDLRPTRKGWTMAIEPATTAAMKEAAPMSSPTAREPELIFMAAKVEKTSGEPLPKARKVTPACGDGCELCSYAVGIRGAYHRFRHAEDVGNGREVDAEEVTGSYSNGLVPVSAELPASSHRGPTVKSITSQAVMMLNGMAGTLGKRQ